MIDTKYKIHNDLDELYFKHSSHFKAINHNSLFVIVIIFVIPYSLIISTNGDFFPIQSDFPSLDCVSKNGFFNVSYIVFPSIFLCSLGMFLLLIILFHLQMVSNCNCTNYKVQIYTYLYFHVISCMNRSNCVALLKCIILYTFCICCVDIWLLYMEKRCCYTYSRKEDTFAFTYSGLCGYN